MEAVLEAMRLMADLEKLRPISAEQEGRILQKFRLDWNYHSNHLEGNSLTFGETKSLLLFGITAQGKPLKDHIEITGHNEAINMVLDVVKGERPLTESFIRELHTLLLKEPYEVDAITPDGAPTKRMIAVGKYKTAANHVKTVTGEIFYFATPEETPAKMHDLMACYRQERDRAEADPISLAALFHYGFIRIHPFDDGNGRTARLLMNFILMQYGYPPVVIKTEDKVNYFRALQQADGGSTEPFVEYIARNLQHALKIMLAGARGESIDEPDDLDKQLALLDQRLKGIGKKVEVLKSKEAMVEVSDKSIWKLAEAIVQVQAKFKEFYGNFQAMIEAINSQKRFDVLSENKTQFLESIPESCFEVSFYCRLSSFKILELSEISFDTQIKTMFNPNSYKVVVGGVDWITRGYDEQLTDAEIQELALAEGQRHHKMIEAHLANLENAKPPQS